VLRLSDVNTFQLLVDRASGATTMIRNDFTNGKFNFTSIGVVTGAASCTEGYGYDIHDLGVRWSDLDGDGMFFEGFQYLLFPY